MSLKMIKVYKNACQNCLLSKDRIVSSQRAKEMIDECIEKQTHFICHKATMQGQDVMCHSYYEHFGQHSEKLKLCQRLGIVEFVNQPDSDKLSSHQDISVKNN